MKAIDGSVGSKKDAEIEKKQEQRKFRSNRKKEQVMG